MTDPENVLARWSRRKSDARASERYADSAPDDSKARATRSGATQPSDISPPLDLPTLNSISAKTDLRAFLGRAVPAELHVAALRRGWSVDPVIRNFIGLSENSWDFNAPGGIPGFGTLQPGGIRRLLARLTGGVEMNEAVTPASVAPLPSEQATSRMTECDVGSEQPQDMSGNNADSRSAQKPEQDPAPAQVASADSVSAATSMAQPTQDRNAAPSHPCAHGGALPRFGAV
jgi:hypothetical protein